MKRNLNSGQGIAYSIFGGNKLTTNDINSIQKFVQLQESGVSTGKAWTNTMSGCSVAAKQYVVNAKKLGKTNEEIIAGLQTMPKAIKAATVATKALAIAGNMIAMWAISEVISAVVKGLDNLANSAENAKVAAESFASSISEQREEFATNTKTISELNEDYKKYSKGVSELGENVSLTSDEYDNYKDIVSKVSDIMPNLTAQFNDQGEKIGFAQGKLKDLNEEYNTYKKNSAAKILSEGNSDGKNLSDIIEDYNNQKDIGFWSSLANKALSSLTLSGYDKLFSNETLLSS